MGQQSILHAVKARSMPPAKRTLNIPQTNASIAEENEENDGSKSLATQLSNLEFTDSTVIDHSKDKGIFFKGSLLFNKMKSLIVLYWTFDRW